MVDVVRDKEGQTGVDATLLKVLLEEDLEVLIKIVEGRPSVECPPCPVLLSSLRVGEFSVREVVEVLNQKVTVLSSSLNSKSALAGALNANAGVSGEALLALHIILVVILKLLAVGRRNAIFRGNTNVAVLGVTLVDGTLGVGTTRLDIHVSVIIHGMVLERVLRVDVVVKVGSSKGDANLLIAESAGQDDFLVTGLILELLIVSELSQ